MRPEGPQGLAGIVLTPIEAVSTTLERRLGFFSVVIISLSAMIGSGLFVLPSLAFEMVGGGAWLAYVLAALVVIPGALNKSELASAMPTSGGSYIYIERVFGPMYGTMTGLALWASFLLKAAFALIGFSAYLMFVQSYLGTDITDIQAALGMLVLITMINVLGLKRIKSVQTPVVTISILMLLILTLWAIMSGEADYSRSTPTLETREDWMTMGEAASLVLVSYAGVTKVAAIGGEIKNPGKNLPGGIITSLVIGMVLYATLVATMTAVIPPEAFFDSHGHPIEDPVRVFAEIVGGSSVAVFAAVVAILTMTSMALAGILAASRYLFAMSRDNLLPDSFYDVHHKYATPHFAIIVTGLAMALALVTIDVHAVAEFASGFQIMAYVLMCMSVLIMRKATKSHAWYQPEYRAPLHPFLQVFGIITGVSLLYFMGIEAVIGAGTAMAIGFIIYTGYGSRHTSYRISPWETYKLMATDPAGAEKIRRTAAFYAADTWNNELLTLREFESAVQALGLETGEQGRTHTFFQAADENSDGLIRLEEFLQATGSMAAQQE